MIRNLADFSLAGGLGVLYAALAAAVASGAVVGVLAVLLHSAFRGGDS